MISVIVVAEAGGPEEATSLAAIDASRHHQVLVARGWPAHPDGVPGRGEAAAVNAALRDAEGEVVVIVRGGDVPEADAVEGLAAALSDDVDVAVGTVVGDDLAEAWAGPPPPPGVPLPARFLAVRRSTLVELDGLDDRFRPIDVAALDLLGRLRGRVAIREDLRARATTPVDPLAIGVAAQLQGMLEGHSSAASLTLARLRWLAPVHETPRTRFAIGRGHPAALPGDHDRYGIPAPPEPRPPVAVICPFHGTAAEAAAMVGSLAGLHVRPGDEVVLVDNTREGVAEALGEVRVVHAPEQQSSYFARNAGARSTQAPWMLFVDSDCVLHAGLLDAYFAPTPDDGEGALAGHVLDAPADGVIGRWSEATGVLSQPAYLRHHNLPFGVTANLLVRREAFDSVDGFTEGIRSSGDADFCWRMQEAGWSLGWRPRAAVEHVHRTTLRGLLRQYRRYGAGVAWLSTRHPQAGEPWLRPHAMHARLALVDLAAGRFSAASTRAISLVTAAAAARASAEDNLTG